MVKSKEVNIKQKKQLGELRYFVNKTYELKELRKSEITIQRNEKLRFLLNKIKAITPLYNERLQEVKEFIKNNYNKNERLFSLTTFEVVNRHAEENAHSNVIVYLLNKKYVGKKLLKAIIDQVPDKSKDSILQLIETSEFTARREKPINGNETIKRIDIFIESNNFFVAIENKFNAKLHEIDGKSQTEYYYRKLKEKYPYKKSLFILLDKKEELESKNYFSLGYKAILRALEKVKMDFENDIVFMEYYYLLRRIICNLYVMDIEKLDEERSLSKLNNIKNGASINDIGKRFARI